MSEATRACALKRRWSRYPNHNWEVLLCVFAGLLTKMELITAVENRSGQDVITALMSGPHLEVSDTGMPGAVTLPNEAGAKPLANPVPLELAMLLIPFPLVTKIVCLGTQLCRACQGIGKSGSGRASPVF